MQINSSSSCTSSAYGPPAESTSKTPDAASEKTLRVNESTGTQAQQNDASASKSAEQKSKDTVTLSDAEQRQVERLKQRDREVRAHEAAHKAVAGQYANGGPSYSYQSGPDGKRYAVGGEVSIDMSPEKDPQATLRKAQTVQAAAMAPAEPSSQDRSVAASAAAIAAQAQSELRAKESLEKQPDPELKATDTAASAKPGHSANSLENDAAGADRRGATQERRAQEYQRVASAENGGVSQLLNVFA